ncbi:MAG: ribonuclease H-like domain-containing protein [Lachnospiraceae bacterium]|nr:ribonuclease H-like domain-containing protein [Lachnospiraceae bacterium]
MQEIRQSFALSEWNTDFEIKRLGDRDQLLFIDIETTGLSRETTYLYLIGCGYFSADTYQTIQWFAEHPKEEQYILDDFLRFSEGFHTLVNYNGAKFDLPYLKYKAQKHKLPFPLEEFELIDLYPKIKPYGKLLGLPSLKQRSIEDFLGVHSEDPNTGRDLISVWFDYVREPSKELLKPLLYHNSEDLLGMLRILPILDFCQLSEANIYYVNHIRNNYKALDSSTRSELLFSCTHDLRLPVGFSSLNDRIFISFEKTERLTIRVPIEEGELRHFYENYKDYYYLPAEDICVHKSAASGVDRAHREKAKRENCYSKHSGAFFQTSGPAEGFTLFQTDYKSGRFFFPLSELSKSKEAPDHFCQALIKNLIQ